MLAWDHNAYYHRRLLRLVPVGTERVLEVGCGRGHLAARLAERAEQVDAIDLDPSMVAAAADLVPANVHCRPADVLTDDLPAETYDAVVSLSTLHHVELRVVLPRLAEAVRPGGVIAAIALPRTDLRRDLPVELAATTVHHLLGVGLTLVRHPWRTGLPHPTYDGPVPMKDPVLTVREVRREAQEVLPSATVRRLLLWRYLLVWRNTVG